MEYYHIESLLNGIIREIAFNIEEKWMKTSKRSDNSEIFNRIDLNSA